MVGVSLKIIVICFWGTLANTENFSNPCRSLSNYVDCSGEKLLTIPNNLKNWTRQLNLNNNNIEMIDGNSWKSLPNLRELKLNKNKLHQINKGSFDNLKRLKILEISSNQIKSIEALSFKPLEQVTILKLKKNVIEKLPDGSFYGLTKIKSLILDYNLVHTIKKEWLYDLNNLKELSLSNNLIDTIENDAWEFCKGLTELNLSYNRMKSIKRDTFKDLNNLQKLILNNNSITFIEENAFTHTPNLKILNLSSNKISWTIEDANSVFRGLTNLTNFYVAFNDIKSINKNAFSGLYKVSYLDLSGNNVTSIQQNAFADMDLLEGLALNTNSLLCDCNIQWFYEYLQLKRLNITTICAYPDMLKGHSLLSVPAKNFTCDELPKPRIIEEPSVEIMALKDENISLSCKAVSSSTSEMVFQWKKDNIELSSVNVKSFVKTDGKNTESISYLNITKVQHSDAGKYQCVVSNRYGTTYSQKSSISVLIYPTFNKIPSNITVRAGTTARLDCSASGEPMPEIAWQKDGGNDFPAARERRMQVMPADDVFFIVNAKTSDMGVYSCTAKNAAGIIVANATLNIEDRPSFVKPMEDKEVTAGESVVLPCMASGSPKPTIQWLKDGHPISATERHFFTAEEQLMIIVDTILSDSGIYTCKLNNSLGFETAHSTLVVKPVLMSYSDMWGIIIITVVSCAVFTSGIWVVIIYQTRRRMGPPPTIKTNSEPIITEFAETIINHFSDNHSEHSKDSGTGDSAKRSNDDLPAEEYTLIINEEDKNKSLRTASLVYLTSEAGTSQTPLLYTKTPYTRSTNHDRLSEKSESDLNNIKKADAVNV